VAGAAVIWFTFARISALGLLTAAASLIVAAKVWRLRRGL
jgi:hypothetical protein